MYFFVLGIEGKVPKFKWIASHKSSFGIPHLNIKFPDGDIDDAVIFNHSQPIAGLSKFTFLNQVKEMSSRTKMSLKQFALKNLTNK